MLAGQSSCQRIRFGDDFRARNRRLPAREPAQQVVSLSFIAIEVDADLVNDLWRWPGGSGNGVPESIAPSAQG